MKKKHISVFIALLLSGCIVAAPTATAFAAETDFAGNQNGTVLETADEQSNSLEEELENKQIEQRESNGNNIFSVSVSGNLASVEMETKTGGTVIVAVYDEAGVQMITSASKKVASGTENVSLTLDSEKLPDYFYLRAFLVETDSLRPLCTVYESPNYTKDMKDFLALTTDDIIPKKLLNFDDNKLTNFAVYRDSTILITGTQEQNKILSADEENLVYVIANIDNTMASLKKGDIFVLKNPDGSLLSMKVSEIILVGNTTATIQGEKVAMNEVFEYVKIDAVSDMQSITENTENISPELQFDGLKTDETTSLPAFVYQFAETDVTEENQDETPTEQNGEESQNETPTEQNGEESQNEIPSEQNGEENRNETSEKTETVSGSLALGMTAKVKYYLTQNNKYVEFSLHTSLKTDAVLSEAIDKKFQLGTYTIPVIAGTTVKTTPAAIISSDTPTTLAAEFSSNTGFSSDGSSVKDFAKAPELKISFDREGTASVGVIADTELDVFNNAAAASVQSDTAMESVSDAATENSDSLKHTCQSCIEGVLNQKVDVSASVCFENSEALTGNFDDTGKQADFYASADTGKFGLGICPGKSYQVVLNVKDSRSFENIAGAVIDIGENSYQTDENGNVSLFLASGEYNTIISAQNYKEKNESFSVYNDSKRTVFYLTAESIEETPEVPSAIEDYGNDPRLAALDVPVRDVKMSYNDLAAAVTKNGTLYMWGQNTHGQLGNGSTKNNGNPQKIMTNVKSVSLGYRVAAAVKNNGELYMWGYNEYGQVGDGSTMDSSSPLKILENVKSVSLGRHTSYAVTNDGDLYAWGYNNYGQVGDGTSKNQVTPVKIMKNVAYVCAGAHYAAAITKSGDLYTWGYNNNGQLGTGNMNRNYTTPTKIMSNVKYVTVSLSENCSTAAITDTNDLYMWGNNSYGRIGNGNTSTVTSPTKIMSNVKEVSMGSYHSAAVTNSHELYTWGYNYYGQLGNNTSYYSNSYKPVKIMDKVRSVSLGYEYTTAITDTDTLYAWGYNNYGQLGINSTYSHNTPVKVMDNVAKVIAADQMISAYTYDNGVLDGGLYFWGRNDYGIGSSTSYRTIPYRLKLNTAKTTSTSAAIVTTDKLSKFYDDLQPNTVYNFYVMASKTENEPLENGNLYYMTQAVSDSEGRAEFTYAPTVTYETADRFVAAMQKIDLSDAGAEIADVLYDGETKYADPVVMLDDLQLLEGRDYELTGCFLGKEPGEYTFTVNGIGDYTGSLDLTYNMVMEFRNLSSLAENKVLLGDEVSIKAASVGAQGDCRYSYYFRSVSDPYWSVLDVDSAEDTLSFETYKVGQYYARIDVKDSTGEVKRKIITFDVLPKSLVNLSSISSAKTAPNTVITVTGVAQGGNAPYRYACYYKNVYDNKWKTAKSFDASAIVNLSFDKEGMYDVCMKVKDEAGSVAKSYFAVQVENEKILPLKNMSSVSTANLKFGSTLNIKAAAQGGKGDYSYAVYCKKSSKSVWTTLQDYSDSTSVSFQPDAQTSYDICVKVRDERNVIVKKYFTVNVISPELINTSKIFAESILQGQSVTLSGTAKGGTAPYLFAFYTKLSTATSWTTAQNFDTNTNISFKPAASGDYDICIKVKDAENKVVNKYFNLHVEANELKDKSTLSATTIEKGQSVTVTAAATGGIGSYTYAFFYKKSSVSGWTTKQNFSTNNTVSITLTEVTKYDICVKVKDENGTITKTYFTVNVVLPALKNTSSISAETVSAGDTVTVNASATGGVTSYTYGVYYKKSSSSDWTTKQNFTSNQTVSIKLTDKTSYDICVKVKDSKGTVDKKYFTVKVQ